MASGHIGNRRPAWPGNAPFAVWLTHDVDRVRKTYQYATDLLSRRRMPDFRALVRGENPYYNFSRILALEKSLGVRSTFFFLEETMPARLGPMRWAQSLGKYHFSDELVAAAIRGVSAAGGEIGLHGSYRSYLDKDLLLREKQSLEQVTGGTVVATRQHYLNLEVPTTWRIQEEAGFRLDSSYGSVREIGFPDGKYWPFQPEGLSIVVAPLIVSDAAILYNGWSGMNAKDKIGGILSQATRFQALVTVLWHQRFLNPAEFPFHWNLYRWVCQKARSEGAWFASATDLVELWGS